MACGREAEGDGEEHCGDPSAHAVSNATLARTIPSSDRAAAARATGKYARVLPFVSQRNPISRLPLIRRALVVPTSRGTFILRAQATPRSALSVTISRGALIPRAIGIPMSRETFLPWALATPTDAHAVLISRATLLPRALGMNASRGTFLRRALATPRAALAAPASRGTFLRRAHATSSGAVVMLRASLGSSTSRHRFVPRARASPTPRRRFVPRETVSSTGTPAGRASYSRGASNLPVTRSVVRAQAPAPDRAQAAQRRGAGDCAPL